MNITIDKEFKTLIPPLSAEEFDQLEANCLENGIQDSLKTWNGVLVDGHNRYEIAEKHGLEFKTEEMEFSGRTDAKLWIIKNQLGRRNLSTYDRSILALKLKPVIVEKAKEKQAEYHGNQHDGLHQKSDKEQVTTAKELAKVAGVSHDTIHKVETIEKSDNEEVKQAVRNKEMSINKAYHQIKGTSEKKASQPQTEVRDVEITVTNEDVMKNPVQAEVKEVKFIETDESNEEVEDVAKDVAETAGLSYADDILSGITKIVNTVKYNRADVVGEICKLDCDEFNKGEFKDSLEECIKVLVRLKNGLAGY